MNESVKKFKDILTEFTEFLNKNKFIKIDGFYDIYHFVEKLVAKYTKEKKNLNIFFKRTSNDSGELIVLLEVSRFFHFKNFGEKLMNELDLVGKFEDELSNEIKNSYPFIYIVIIDDKGIRIFDVTNSKIVERSKNKINKLFLDKIKGERIKNFKDLFEELRNNKDIIEDFKTLLNNKLKKRFIENVKLEFNNDEYVTGIIFEKLSFLLMAVYYLQERGFFNDGKLLFKYFKDENIKNKFSSYSSFLKIIFERLFNGKAKNVLDLNLNFPVISHHLEDIFRELEFNKRKIDLFTVLHLLDDKKYDNLFYVKGSTEELIKNRAKNIPSDFKFGLLNLFESRDWSENGEITKRVLGDLFETLISEKEKKQQGIYYTPEEIVNYIVENSVSYYLLDKIFDLKYKVLNPKKELFKRIEELKDLNTLKKLISLLKDIKILDPACGSGHFLENSLEYLTEIHLKIIEKINRDENLKKRKDEIKEYTFELADGRKVNLLNFDINKKKEEKKIKLLLKYLILILRNIYGVDIMEDATSIAKTRLFLCLIDDFDFESKDFVYLPGLMFNIRKGNSLVGFVNLEDLKNEKVTVSLLSFFSNRRLLLFSKKDSIIKKLEKIKESAFKNEIEKIINKINEIKGELNRDDIEKLLNIQNDLKNLYVKLINKEDSKKIKEVILDLEEVMKKALDKRLYELMKEKKVVSNESFEEIIKELKPFHWIITFPEVFDLGKNKEEIGFDVIVGNPPYVRQEKINSQIKKLNYKLLLSKLYKPFENSFDLSMFFILRSVELLKNRGYNSFIITNKWLRAGYGKKIRKYLKENSIIKKVIDLNGIRVFVEATVDTMIYVIKKEKPGKDIKIFYNNPKNLRGIENEGYFVKQSRLEDDVWNFIDERMYEIKKWIEKVGVPLKELDVKILYGIKTGYNEAFIIDKETRRKLIEEDPKSKELIKPVLRGRDIGRYYASWSKLYLIVASKNLIKDIENYPAIKKYLEKFKDKLKKRAGNQKWWQLQGDISKETILEFEKPKIIWQEIVKEPSFYLEQAKIYGEATSFIMTSKELNLKFLLSLLNSRLSWCAIYFYGTNLGKDTARYKKSYIEKIPIRLPNNTQPFEILTDYLLFLNMKPGFRENLKEIISFFDKVIVDSLVYELYFKEKFYEDKIYPEPKGFLLEKVSKYLKLINYDKYAEIYWELQLEKDSTQKEKLKKELEQLEERNLKVIQKVYEKLKNDKEIQEIIGKIKNHSWVKIIEGNKS